jgi:hypothetical protein
MVVVMTAASGRPVGDVRGDLLQLASRGGGAILGERALDRLQQGLL